jgi:O-antigen biosynthesis protein
VSRSCVFMPAAVDACALWRFLLPHLHIEKSRFVFENDCPSLSVTVPRQVIFPMHEVLDADVIAVQRCASNGNLSAMKIMRKVGVKIIYDIDDDLWNVPVFNPAHELFRNLRYGLTQCVGYCDALTVSTERLKTVVRQHVPELKRKEITVIPNAIDLDYFKERRQPLNPERFVVGWGGSNTHERDVAPVFRVLPGLIEVEPTLYLEFVGANSPPESIHGHPQVKLRPWTPVAEYASRLSTWSWDLFLAPLADHPFNKSKSNIKILEAAAVGAPILVSDIGEYGKFCRMDKDLRYLLCNGSKEWARKIRELLHEPDRRAFLVERMRHVVREHYTIERSVARWKVIIEGV